MNFSKIEGFEEFFSDGVIDPSITSSSFQKNRLKFTELHDRLFLLHEPLTTPPEFDMVFVHGIGSDEFKCWTNSKGIVWPSVFIPQDFGTTRVLTLGYQHALWDWKRKAETSEAAQRLERDQSAAASFLPPAKNDSFPTKAHSSWSAWWDEGSAAASASPATRPVVEAPKPRMNKPRTALYKVLLASNLCADRTATAEVVSASDCGEVNSNRMSSMRYVAADAADRLVACGVGTTSRPIVFVAHSMGGLVTKQLLVLLSQLITLTPQHAVAEADVTLAPLDQTALAVSQAKALLYAIRGVVFYATPHFGSGLASVITGLKRYYQNLGGLTPSHVVSDLGDHNRDQLNLLNEQFLDVVRRLGEEGSNASVRGAPGISLLSFGETRKLHGLVRIVEPDSANPAPSDPRFPFYLIDGDHSEINRPPTKTSPSYAILYGFLDRMQQRKLLLPDVVTPPGTPLLPEGPLPVPGELSGTVEDAWDTLFNDMSTAPRPLRGTSSPSFLSALPLTVSAMEEELERLRCALEHLYGRVIPAEVDRLFLLSNDVKDFLRSSATQIGERVSGNSNTADLMHQCLVSSFSLPSGLLTYWIRRARDMTNSFALSNRERNAKISTGDALVTRGVSSHLTNHEVGELSELGQELTVLQEEWEVFRRFWSIAVRRATTEAPATLPWAAYGHEEVSVMYFSRSMRLLLKHSGLCGMSFAVSQFLLGAMQVRANETQPTGGKQAAFPSSTYPEDEGMLLEAFAERDEGATLLAAGLSTLSDTSKGQQDLGMSALTAFSNFLLGHFSALQGCTVAGHNATARMYLGNALTALETYESICAGIRRRDRKRRPLSNSRSFWSLERPAAEDLHRPNTSFLLQQRLSTLTLTLLTHTLMCWTLLSDFEEAISSRMATVSTERASSYVEPLVGSLAAGIRAYRLLEDALQGGDTDRHAPFAGVAATDTTRGASPKQVPEEEATKKLQCAFRDAVASMLEEMDALPDDKPKDPLAESKTEVAAAEREGSLPNGSDQQRSSWYDNRGSRRNLSSILIGGLLGAWESVRRGGEMEQTPSYFAHNALVLWWTVEERSWTALQGPLPSSSSEARKQVIALEGQLQAPMTRPEGQPITEDGATTSGNARGSGLFSLLPRQKVHYDESHHTIQNLWTASMSHTHAVRHFSHAVQPEPVPGDDLNGVPSTHCAPSPTHVMVKTLQLSGYNPLARCLLGHYYFFDQNSLVDAAHAYADVMQLCRCPLDRYYQTAAVGLGWTHLRSVSAGAVHCGALEEGGQVLDQLALLGAPEAYTAFLRRVHAFTISTTTTPGATLRSTPRRSSAPPTGTVPERLALAETYFRGVLDVNPTSVGALCGLGRLRSLSFVSAAAYSPLPAANSVASQSLDNVYPYFLAAARLGGCRRQASSVHGLLNTLHSSYAAYWTAATIRPRQLPEDVAMAIAAAHYGGVSAPPSVQHAYAAMEEASQWLSRALQWNQKNDWALTSLGFHHLERAHHGSRAAKAGANFTRECCLDKLQGVHMLEEALRVNPTNQWALWGVANYSSVESRRTQCRQLLQTLLRPKHVGRRV